MAAADITQGQLVMLYQCLVLSGIEYGGAILTTSDTQMDRLERIQNEAMCIILGCTRDTPCVAMRYLLDFPSMAHRIDLWRARAHFRISANIEHPLHEELGKERGNRLKRGKSWVGRAEDIIRRICEHTDIPVGEEWVSAPYKVDGKFGTIITLDRSCRERIPTAVDAEVRALIDENAEYGDVEIYTDGSVVRHQRCAWAFSARSCNRTVKECSGAFAVTTSCLTLEVMAVTEAFRWLESQDYVRTCILSDSMSMIRRIEAGRLRKQWVQSLGKSTLKQITFIFVPGYAGVEGNERADFLIEGQPMDRGDIINALR